MQLSACVCVCVTHLRMLLELEVLFKVMAPLGSGHMNHTAHSEGTQRSPHLILSIHTDLRDFSVEIQDIKYRT